jgi:hypothetical protein
MTIKTGDIVTLADREGVWVASGPAPTSGPDQWNFVRRRPGGHWESISLGVVAATLLVRPVFSEGLVLRDETRRVVTVLADLGDTVRCEWPEENRPTKFRRQTVRFAAAPCDKSKPDLVLRNLATFLG